MRKIIHNVLVVVVVSCVVVVRVVVVAIAVIAIVYICSSTVRVRGITSLVLWILINKFLESADKQKEEVTTSTRYSTLLHSRPSSRKPMNLIRKTVGFGFSKKKSENSETKIAFNEDEIVKVIAGYAEEVAKMKVTLEEYKVSLGFVKKPVGMFFFFFKPVFPTNGKFG